MAGKNYSNCCLYRGTWRARTIQIVAYIGEHGEQELFKLLLRTIQIVAYRGVQGGRELFNTTSGEDQKVTCTSFLQL